MTSLLILGKFPSIRISFKMVDEFYTHSPNPLNNNFDEFLPAKLLDDKSNTPEPLTVRDEAPIHRSIVPYFGGSTAVGEFADQLPWMFARYKRSCEHLNAVHQGLWGKHKVKIVYGLLVTFILLYLIFLTPLGFIPRQLLGLPW